MRMFVICFEKELLLKSCKFRRVLRLKLPLDELPTTLRVKAAEEVSSNGIIIWEPAAKTIKSSPEPPKIKSHLAVFLIGFHKT